MVIRMCSDLAKWVMIAIIPVLGFAFALHALYKDPYAYDNKAQDDEDCVYAAPDSLFESATRAILFMVTAMLSADGQYKCFRESSQPIMGTCYMMGFTLVTVIMLVNMLIALMAKTFDNVFEKQEINFLYLKVRTIDCWRKYTDMPPPLNALSIPYLLYLQLVPCAKAVRARLYKPKAASARKNLMGDHRSSNYDLLGTTRAYRLPSEFMMEFGDNPVTALTEQMVEFMSEHGDEIVREDRWKTEVLQTINSKMRPLESVQEDLYSLNENVEAMQGQLRTIVKMMALQHAGSINSSAMTEPGAHNVLGMDLSTVIQSLEHSVELAGKGRSMSFERKKADKAANKLNFRLPGSNKPSAKLERKMTLKDAVLQSRSTQGQMASLADGVKVPSNLDTPSSMGAHYPAPEVSERDRDRFASFCLPTGSGPIGAPPRSTCEPCRDSVEPLTTRPMATRPKSNSKVQFLGSNGQAATPQ
eukprot:7109903-Prymnesium_polylepis.1